MGLHSVTCHPAEVTFSTLLAVGNKSSKCKKAINKSRKVQNFLTVSNFSKKLLSVLPTSLCPASSIHSAVKMTLPAFAAGRPSPLLSCPHRAQQQTRRTVVERRDRRTDWRTRDRYIVPVSRTHRRSDNTEMPRTVISERRRQTEGSICKHSQ